MRLALSSLIVAVGVASAAYAQDPAAQPAPPAAAPTAPAPAPEAGAPAAQAAPEAAPPAAAEPPPPPPALPTSGVGAEALAFLDKVCVPAARGEALDALAKANGFKLNRRDLTWSKPLTGDRAYQVIVLPIGSNKGVCNAELRYAVGQDAEVAKALNVWAFVRQPPLEPTANYTQAQDPDGLKRVRRSWEYLNHDAATGQNQSVGLNFSTVRKPDDTPLNPRYDTATLQYQERTF